MHYPGGKGKCFQHIVNLLPPHTTYIEAFVGGGSVLRHKAPAHKSIAIDIDTNVVRWWRQTHPSLATYLAADALAFLQTYPFDGSEVVYCDPPYLPSTRKRSRVYRHDLTFQDHCELLQILKSVPSRVIISGYSSELYKTELTGWQQVEFTAKAHDGVRLESLWANYPLPKKLHDARFLGANFRQRQDIKRRLERIRHRISTLSVQEQHEIAAWITCQLQKEGEGACRNSHI